MVKDDKQPNPLSAEIGSELEETSQRYVGRWNRLISTTNWEKGAIISQWRQALIDAETPRAESTDEAWSLAVGHVTPQHVGRLRRVSEQFGQVRADYEGLYWSHFQAALDWDDAEMWLEGAVQSGWSVSHMRRQRWQALGAVAELEPHDQDIIVAELDEDVELEEQAQNLDSQADPATISETVGLVQEPGGVEDEESGEIDDEPPKVAVELFRPFENLAPLPADLADAFESFKLAILHHKVSDWNEISREDVLATLEALKQLAVAPAES